eukprot:6211382-Pleurochrysis_carterae.AAC.3
MAHVCLCKTARMSASTWGERARACKRTHACAQVRVQARLRTSRKAYTHAHQRAHDTHAYKRTLLHARARAHKKLASCAVTRRKRATQMLP